MSTSTPSDFLEKYSLQFANKGWDWVGSPPLFWLVDILLKLASFITPSFTASAGDPQAYKAISSPSLVTNLRTGNIYPALLSCDTNTQVCCLSKNSANIKSLFF